MKRKRWLLFCSYFICFLLKCTSQTNHVVYVCPIETDVASKLTQYRYQLMCNSTALLHHCLLNHEFLRDSYSHFIVLLHDGDWLTIKNVTEHLSRCNVKYMLMDIHAPMIDFLTSTCSAARTTLIFGLTKRNVYSAPIKLPDDNCVTKFFTKNNKLMQQISSPCPNTMWIVGTSDCQNMTNYGEKVLALNSERDVMRDKSLGKMFLKGSHLRLGMIVDPPYYMETKDGGHYGILHNLVEKMASNLQFNYTVHYPADNQYGGKNADGTWSGLVGELINNVTDVIIADLTMTYARSESIDFTLPYYFESIGILIREPELESKLWKMLSLFTAKVWLAILASVILSSITLWGLHKFSPIPIGSPFNSLGECFWCTISCFSNQGSEYDPISWSAQNFMALFWLYVLAILSIYSGGLIAMLTSSHMVLPFKDLEGLSMAVKQDQFKVCVAEGTAFYDTLMAGVGVYGNIRDWLLKNPSYSTDQNTCESMLTKHTDFAYLEELTVLEGIQNKYCPVFKLILLNDVFFPGYFSIGLPKNSSLNEIFSEQLTKAVDGGLILGWKKNFTADTISFCKILQPGDIVIADSNDLTLTEFAGPFVLLGIGIAASVLGFVYELRRLISRTKKKTIYIDTWDFPRHRRHTRKWI